VTDEEEQSSFARWEQPAALGRGGLALMVVVPFVIAAIGFAIVSWVSSDTDTEATTVRVPTSAWIPGQAAGSDRIAGRLEIDDDQCVRLIGIDGEAVVPVWPAGFTARLTADGLLSLYDGGRDLVGRGGEQIEAFGTIEPAQNYRDAPCVPESGDVAVVQSDVTSGS